MKPSRITLIIGGALALTFAPLFADGDEKNIAGHSIHGEAFNEGPRQAAYLMDGMPNVHFPVTHVVPEAQKFFDQGVGQLHGFWYFEAERSFRQALKIDSKCVMAFWGMARSNINNQERGRGFLATAVERKGELTPREQMWIDSLAAYYRLNTSKDSKTRTKQSDAPKESTTPKDSTAPKDSNTPKDASTPKDQKDPKRPNAPKEGPDDNKQRRMDMIKALENIIEKFPDDIEAKAFLVFQIYDNAGAWPIGSRMAVDSLTRDILRINPMHPIHHYRVHLWDGSDDARRSLDSAAFCGQSGPGIAHLWHMPGGHTYTPVKRYRDAVWQQEASNRVDHFHMMHDGVMPDLIHNYAHNSSWLSSNLCLIGRVHPAMQIAENLAEMPRHPKYNNLALEKAQPGYNVGNASAKLARERLFEIPVRFELWDTLLSEEKSGHLDPYSEPAEQTRIQTTMARAYFFKKDFSAGDAIVNQISETYRKLSEERCAASAEAELKAAREKKNAADISKARDEAQHAGNDVLSKVANRIDELNVVRAFSDGKFKETLAGFAKLDALPRELKIHMRLEAGDKVEAEKLARQFVKEGVNQVAPLAILADVLWRSDKQDEAKTTFKTLRDLEGKMDLDVPMFQRLKPIAQALGLPDDWRVEPPIAKDVGIRPTLDSLGPFLWKPSLAPEFSLPGSNGAMYSPSQYHGRPMLLMFYLGHGCKHCIEQLNTFEPMNVRFNQAGISIMAIGTDPVENVGLTMLKSKLEKGFPFPILADPSKTVFKAFRAFDDFENMPLHGTFLLDKDGMIVWQDIGYEPFTNAEFLLKESQRLLALKRAL